MHHPQAFSFSHNFDRLILVLTRNSNPKCKSVLRGARYETMGRVVLIQTCVLIIDVDT
jgi:hypothetical protein